MKSKKSNLLRGLAALLCALLTFSVIATSTASAYASTINSFFNLKVGEMVPIDDGEQIDSVYYKSSYGDLTVENLAKLKADGEKFVEQEMVEGAVLLHNPGKALPLAADERSVTLFGLASAKPYYKNKSAGGNNDPTREASLYSALKEKGFNVNETLYNAYLVPQEGDDGGSSCGGTASPAIDRPLSFYTDELKATFDDYSDVAIVVVGRMGGENQDIPTTDDDGISGLALHQNEADMLRMINESGKFGKIILLLNSAYPLELNHLDEYNIDSVLWIGTPGLTGFRGVVDLLVGEASPSGRLVDTYATDSLSAPATQNFGLFYFDNAAEITASINDHEYNTTKYLVLSEGIYVGYKYYETRYEDCILGRANANGNAGVFASKGGWSYADEVAYPFGFGLSYTTFEQTLDSVTEENGVFTVKVTVKNTGDVAGKDVVEVYAQTPYTDYDRANLVEKSAIQLAGFGKTGVIQPGASETVTVTVDKYLIASYDYKNAKGYILDAGDYYLAIGSDCHDALNNVLAAKGATGMVDPFGNSVTGDAAKTFKWTESELDTETYRRTEAGAEVKNLFDDADINYWLPGAVTYLTRQDWNTFPQPVRGLNATKDMMWEVDGYTYSKPENAPSYASIPQGIDSGIKLVNMHGVPYDDPMWDAFLDQLTLDEMLSTVCGSWSQSPVEKIMKPQNINADGPGGVAGPYLPDILGATATATDMGGGTESGTAYVGEAVAAATWSTEMLAKRGDLMAEDCLFSDVTEIWSPGGNTHRTPFSGRNYEYFSEDGTLAYLLAAAESRAMQAKGVVAAIKHFALNEMEDDRQGVATFLTEQALREIYLKAFEGSFVKGGSTGTMTAFNRVGLTYAGAHRALLKDLLRGEWGFHGATISDAANFPYQHPIEGIANGTDIWCTMGETDRDATIRSAILDNDDGNLFLELRESQHGLYYMFANSNLINGLTSNMKYVTHTPWWQTALYAIDGVLGAAALAVCVLYVLNAYVKKEEK